MSNEWLKIKILRDLNKIYNANSGTSNNTFNQFTQINQLKKSYSREYLNLLELVQTTWLYNVMIPTRKINISDLNNMDLDLFKDVTTLRNVKIVTSPLFQDFVIQNGQLYAHTRQVGDVRYIDTLLWIKKHPHNLFHVYQIKSDSARWYQGELSDKALLKKNRVDKLKILEELSEI